MTETDLFLLFSAPFVTPRAKTVRRVQFNSFIQWLSDVGITDIANFQYYYEILNKGLEFEFLTGSSLGPYFADYCREHVIAFNSLMVISEQCSGAGNNGHHFWGLICLEICSLIGLLVATSIG